MMTKKIITAFLVFLVSGLAFSQGSAGESAKFEYRKLIDMPTAGILDKRMVAFTSEILPDGALIIKLEAGIFDNINFGMSYGGSNVIGSGDINLYPFPPGINFRARIINESVLVPAITLGFDTQGKGIYSKDDKRYSVKAPGIFGAVSKNFEFLGYLSLHGVINYNILEDEDGDNFINFMVGAEKTIGSTFSILAEYNFALNDNSKGAYGQGDGYLNFGFRWSVGNGVTVGLDIRDVLSNKSSPYAADRGLLFEYIQGI